MKTDNQPDPVSLYALEKERNENHKAYVTMKEWAHKLEYQLIEVVEMCEEAAREEPAGSFPDNLIGTINKLVLGELTSKHQKLEQDRDQIKAAAGFCAKHQPDGGTRNCLVCACEKMSFALSRISYLCGPSNEMGVSDYDTNYCEDEVVKQVTELKEALEGSNKTLCFFASVIKSGEPWTLTCESALREALSHPAVQALKKD